VRIEVQEDQPQRGNGQEKSEYEKIVAKNTGITEINNCKEWKILVVGREVWRRRTV